MAAIVLVVNHRKPGAVELAHEAADWLMAGDHEVRLGAEDAAAAGLAKYGRGPDELVPGADLAVSLGGDGTMLRTVDLVAEEGVPVLGVNLGRLGYLTEVEPEGLAAALERFLAGSYILENRLMLAVTPEVAGSLGPSPPYAAPSGTHRALNEVVVEKSSAGQVVHVAVSFDGRGWTTYAADGLILATPTGSTAYAFSARGPILPPLHRAMLLTPVSPHMPFDRSLVLGPDTVVRVEVIADPPAQLIVDGRELGLLSVGDAITCRAARDAARFVTFASRDFYGILKAKFGLADR